MRWQTITDPRAVKLLLDNERVRALTPFLLGPASIKMAAEHLGWPLKTVHDRMRTLEAIGLVRVVRSEARRGRPIKHYQATADGFFVPFYATTSSSFDHFLNQALGPSQTAFNTLFSRAGSELIEHPDEAGYRVYAQHGTIYSDLTPTAERFDVFRDLMKPEAPALMLSYVTLRLTREDAKQLQRDMVSLIERYSSKRGPEGYVMHLGLTPGAVKESD